MIYMILKYIKNTMNFYEITMQFRQLSAYSQQRNVRSPGTAWSQVFLLVAGEGEHGQVQELILGDFALMLCIHV